MSKRKKVILMGAGGRDYHNFNCVYRDDPAYEVVAFTATQIPGLEGRRYPPELAGKLYPEGIPIVAEAELLDRIRRDRINEVVFCYSDVSHMYVMHLAARINAAGADFRMMGAGSTMLKSKVPVISVCAVRTGSGKSQTTRRIAILLREAGHKVVVVRHPMAYGDLVAMKVQRFATMEDMDRQKCTIEEREEYEHHVNSGTVVYAGVDYGAILAEAEKEAEIILWDGGNNDTPFYVPDLEIVVVDPHRAGHETSYYPGETNLRRADVVLINKVDTAEPAQLNVVRRNVRELAPTAKVIEAASPIRAENFEIIEGKRVLVVEDGPTVTHGEMSFGAGTVAAKRFLAADIVDPRPWAVGTIAETFRTYPWTGPLLPAMGYGDQQVKDLEETIRNTDCDLVVIGTPIDLRRLLRIEKPAVRVYYSLQEIGEPTLADVVKDFLTTKMPRK